MAIINSKGKVIANVAQPTVAFNTEAEYNEWLATLPNPNTDIDKFVIIKNYENLNSRYEHLINVNNMTADSSVVWAGIATFSFVDADGSVITTKEELMTHLSNANYGGYYLPCHARFNTNTGDTARLDKFEFLAYGVYVDTNYQYLLFECINKASMTDFVKLYLALDSTGLAPNIVIRQLNDHVSRL